MGIQMSSVDSKSEDLDDQNNSGFVVPIAEANSELITDIQDVMIDDAGNVGSLSSEVPRHNLDRSGLAEYEKSSETDIVEEMFYCFICMDTRKNTDGFILTCGHQFCRRCLDAYLSSNITEANTIIKCFYPIYPHMEVVSETPIIGVTSISDTLVISRNDANKPDIDIIDQNKEESVNQRGCHDCGVEICLDTIKEIVLDESLVTKYTRFKYMKDKSNARECPKCLTFNISGSPTNTRLCCENICCRYEYCYLHGDAHPSESCHDYELRYADVNKASIDFIMLTAKRCPGCAMFINKSGGCNHMKCPHCSQAFCWLCLTKIGDDVFPAHFQWWNATGSCANLQMDDALEPSVLTRYAATALMIMQMVILGPLVLIFTGLSVILCCFCIQKDKFQEFVTQCLSTWGLIWLFLLVFVPLGAVCFGFSAVIFICSILVMPFYRVVQYVIKRHGEAPPSSESIREVVERRSRQFLNSSSPDIMRYYGPAVPVQLSGISVHGDIEAPPQPPLSVN